VPQRARRSVNVTRAAKPDGVAGPALLSSRIPPLALAGLVPGREGRLARAGVLLEGLRGALGVGVVGGVLVAAEGVGVPAVERGSGGGVAGGDGEGVLEWLGRLVGEPVGSVEYERVLAGRMGPDLFELAGVPLPPRWMAGVDQGALGAELVAPLLRRLSLTRRAPGRAELAVAALGAKAGRVVQVRRGARARRWGQPARSGAPLLPEVTAIPLVVHGIWLGGAVVPAGRFAAGFAAAARRHAGAADVVVWTDVPRAVCVAAERGAGQGRGRPGAEGGQPGGGPHGLAGGAGDGLAGCGDDGLADDGLADDGLAGVRAMLAWAREHGIALVNVYEVFHAGAPMLGQAQFAAEMAKQLPRGYAGASDLLRLEIIHRFGGLYTDGDNQIGTDASGCPLPGSLPGLLAAVAASVPGFTLHLVPPSYHVNNDVLIAPARHPAVRLLMEVMRISYFCTQPQLFGGLPAMAQRFVGRPSVQRWRRYTVPWRVGWMLSRTLMLLRLSPPDGRLVRVEHAITAGSELSWSRDGAGGAGAGLSGARVVARAARVVAVLARQLVTREGDLHLTAVAPVVAGLPDPGAAWIAVLRLVAELAERGVVPAVRSVTWFRWADDGSAEQVVLPPEAQELVETVAVGGGWLGGGAAAAGEPAWLLDEAVVAARLRVWPVPGGRRAALRALTRVVAGADGGVAGLCVGPARPGAGGPVVVPAGYVAVEVAGRLGQPWAGPHPLAPEDVAVLLGDLGLAGRPVLLVDQARPGGGPTLCTWAAHLAALLHQPVLAVEAAHPVPARRGPAWDAGLLGPAVRSRL
jgi:hypothetical protein